VALAARLVGRAVDDARTAGCSWTDIGEHLGISRQAAQQRYTPRWASLTLSDLVAAGHLTRYTDRARNALLDAEAKARELGHASVAPGHLVVAALTGENVAVRALRALGARPSKVVRDVERTLRQEAAGEGGSPSVNAAARRCLESTLGEALALGHNYIGTEHLLLGLLHDDAIAEIVGHTADDARIAVVAELAAMMRERGLT
jgi:hypothetical protein